MTVTGQNITTTQGDTENLVIVIDITETPSLDIEMCFFDWVVYRQTTKEVVLEKTTASGIVADNVTNEIIIHIDRDETNELLGHYLHLCKMIDDSNNEFTVTTGTFDVGDSPI